MEGGVPYYLQAQELSCAFCLLPGRIGVAIRRVEGV